MDFANCTIRPSFLAQTYTSGRDFKLQQYKLTREMFDLLQLLIEQNTFWKIHSALNVSVTDSII